jgi:hypothetical protein
MNGLWAFDRLNVAPPFAVELLRPVEHDAEQLAYVACCFELGSLALAA